MKFGILGPVEVTGAGRPTSLTGRRERALLAALVMSAGDVVSTDRLVDAIWGDEVPRAGTKALQNSVLKLRKELGASVIETHAPGYRLAVPPDHVDAKRFEELVRFARNAVINGSPERASTALRNALHLWRGAPLPELADWPPAQGEAARLDELHHVAREELMEAELGRGRHAECVAELESMVAAEPLRERRWELLMLALYRSARQADALRAYQRARTTLTAELGIEPGPQLQELERKIVTQDAGLRAPERVREPDATAPSIAGGGVVFILFSDLSGSTQLLERLGDDAAEDLRRIHFRLLRDAVVEHGGREVKNLGDGLMVVFDGGRDALSCAVEMQRAVASHNRAAPEQLGVRIGVHVGEPIRDENDYFGTPVVIARRLCDAAAPGQVLASDLVRELLGAHGAFTFQTLGALTVKGLTEPVPAVEVLGSADDGAVSPARLVASPYKGLVAFEPEDRDVFFGREATVATLIARLHDARFLAVVGASGTGKSSLVRAGIVGGLHGDALDGSSHWPVIVMTPGAHPMSELAARLALESGAPSVSVLHDLETDARGLDLAARQTLATRSGKARLVLVIDQFEELFTLCRDDEERDAFIAELVTGATVETGVVTVVVALRADFYGHCGAYPELARLLEAGTALPGPMSAAEIAAAVEGPAGVAGLRLEPGLVDIVGRDVAEEPGALPLLSHALLETWRRRRGRTLTIDGYRDAGGVGGAIAHTAETVFGGFDPARQRIARDVFVRLTELGEGTEDTRRRVDRSELVGDADSGAVEDVVRTLVDARLVTAAHADVEIAHEALIREWPRLREWLDDDREGLRIHRHLTHAAHDWEAMTRDPAELYRGPRLAAAEEWADANDHAGMNPLEREFLDASRARQQRETAEQARQVHRLRRLLVGTAVALVLALIAGTMAIVQRGRANDEASAARAATLRADVGRLVAESQVVSSRDPYLATLLAVEANRLDDNPATRGALLNALVREPRLQLTMSAGNRGYFLIEPIPRSQLVAVRSADTLDVFDVEAGRQSGKSIAIGRGDGLAASPDGQVVATGADDGTVSFWDVETGAPVGDVIRLGGRARKLAFSPDGRLLAIPEGDFGDPGPVATQDTVGVWDVDSRARLDLPLSGHTASVNVAAFSPDGTLLATGGNDFRVVLHDVRTGATIGDAFTVGSYVHSLAFSPDGRHLAVGPQDGTTSVFDVATGAQLASLPGHGLDVSVQFSSDGRRLVTATDVAQVWDAVTFAPIGPTFETTSGQTAAAFSPDGRQVDVAGFAGIVARWDPEGMARIVEPLPGAPPAAGGVFSPDGALIAVPDRGQVQLYNAESRTAIGRPFAVPPGPSIGVDAPARIAFSPDGDVLAVASLNGTIQRFDTATGDAIGDPIALDAPAISLAFNPSGDLLAAGSTQGTVTLVDPDTGMPGDPITTGLTAFMFVTFSPDGERLVVTAGATGAVVLDPNADRPEPELIPGSVSEVTVLAFSPDGSVAVTGGSSGEVQFRDPETLEPVGAPVPSNQSGVFGIVFSPDGRFLAASDLSPATRLIDAASHQPIGNEFPNVGLGAYVSFSPDGTTMAASSPAGTVLWSMDPAVWRERACGIAGRNLTETEQHEYLPQANGRVRTCDRYPT